MGINVDLSKALHPRLMNVLWALMPGVFFEICVLLGNRELASSLIQSALDRKLALAIALILAFLGVS